jgi:hypothetical protein
VPVLFAPMQNTFRCLEVNIVFLTT